MPRIHGVHSVAPLLAILPVRQSATLRRTTDFTPTARQIVNKRMASVNDRNAVSAVELIAIAAVTGIIAIVVAPQLTTSRDAVLAKEASHHKVTINATVERYYVETGNWPADDLSDIAANPSYFPDGIPDNPLGGRFKLNSKSHRVE